MLAIHCKSLFTKILRKDRANIFCRYCLTQYNLSYTVQFDGEEMANDFTADIFLHCICLLFLFNLC